MDMSAWMEENVILPAFCLATPCGSSSLEWVSQPLNLGCSSDLLTKHEHHHLIT